MTHFENWREIKWKKKMIGDDGRLPVTQLWNGLSILAGDEICSYFQLWESHFFVAFYNAST